MKLIRSLAVGSLTLGALVVAAPARAANITVNTTADEADTGPACSLREAIRSANADMAIGGCATGSGADTITIPAGTYALSLGPNGDDAAAYGDLDITGTSDVTLDPMGTVVIDGADIDSVFHVLNGGVLTISDLTVRNGDGFMHVTGGGIDVALGGTLTLAGVTISDNLAHTGGGINNAGTATLTNVTISGNLATNDGGGLANQTGGAATLNNVTVANNTADSNTDQNGDGGGIRLFGGTVNVSNTIVGDNTDNSTGLNTKHDDCTGTLTSGGYNLIEDVAGCTIGGVTTGNITSKDPQLFALADSGGPTPTHALRKGSDAVDAGNPAAPGSSPSACETTDQRGTTRPQGARCDIGSFEREQPSEVDCLNKPVTITGTTGPDVLTGTDKKDVIQALGGDDVVNALGGNDRVCAGSGNDRVNVGTGNDHVAGQAGNDRVAGASGDDTLSGQGARDRLTGKGGDDTLRGGPKPDNLNGGGGFDTCRGGGGRDRIRRCES